jgi:hypothetical protein
MLFFFSNRNFTVHPIDETTSPNAHRYPGKAQSQAGHFIKLYRTCIMKNSYAAIIALTLSTLAAGYASAADAPKTREQVRAELIEAQRTGDILAQGNSGKKLNELYPSRYPATAVAQASTRAEVLAELAQAKRSGEYDRIHSQHRN